MWRGLFYLSIGSIGTIGTNGINGQSIGILLVKFILLWGLRKYSELPCHIFNNYSMSMRCSAKLAIMISYPTSASVIIVFFLNCRKELQYLSFTAVFVGMYWL